MAFRFVPLGVGDAFTALHYSTCLALEAEGALLLVDCPHPIQKMMREASLAVAGATLAPSRVSAVVLTHLHADHCSGLEGLAFWTFFHERRRLPLYLHREVLDELWHGHLAAGMTHLLTAKGSANGPAVGVERVRMSLDDYFEVHLLDEARAVSCGPFSIECRKTIHHVPTTALRVRAAGRTLGHSADTAFDESLIAWLQEADLVVHETNHGVHTPYEKLAALPAALRAKMRLVHYPDDFDVAASVIEPLREGRIYEV
ncbi:MAG: MBL fold metallo-hydrolase [Deltaproteobacteria bacterium]|nr:MBL fold metallo-hydrolase [Deltaproteobacteria bacterium]